MNFNFLKKKKRITHIGSVHSAAVGDVELPDTINYVDEIIKGMDSTMNKSDSRITSYDFLCDTKLQDLEKQMLIKSTNKSSSSVSSSNECNANTKMKKFLASQQKFPLMAKCQKNLKYLQHNRCVPKQRAHVIPLPKSPLKYSKKNYESYRFTKNKFNKKYKWQEDIKIKEKRYKSSKKYDICSSVPLRKVKTVRKSSKNKKECNSLPADFRNVVSNEQKEICPNDSSDSDGTFENFIKMHLPDTSERNNLKKKNSQVSPMESKKSIQKSSSLSGDISSSESEVEHKKRAYIYEDDENSDSEFHKKSKTFSSLRSIKTTSRHKSKYNNKMLSKEKSSKYMITMEKNDIVLPKNLRRNSFDASEKLSPAKIQKEQLHFDTSEIIHASNFLSNIVASSSESSDDSVNDPQAFECNETCLSEESNSDVGSNMLEKEVKRKLKTPISQKQKTISEKNPKLFATNFIKEKPFDCSDTFNSDVETFKKNLKPCYVLLKRLSYVDNLDSMTAINLSDFNNVSSSSQSKQILHKEHSEDNSLSDVCCNSLKSVISLECENSLQESEGPVDSSIRISKVCSISILSESSNIIDISDSDSENNSSCKNLGDNLIEESCKSNTVNIPVISDKGNSEDHVARGETGPLNRNELILEEKNPIYIPSSKNELVQCIHNEINKNGSSESDSDSSDIEVIEIKSAIVKSSNVNVSANKTSEIKIATPTLSGSLVQLGNINLKQGQLKCSKAASNKFSDQNSSSVSDLIEISEPVKVISSEKCNSAFEDVEADTKDEISANLSTGIEKGFYGDCKNMQINLPDSESDECIILEEKIVQVYSREKTSVMISEENLPLGNTGSNDKRHIKIKSNQLVFNSLKENELNSCNEVTQSTESCVKGSQNLNMKNSQTKLQQKELRNVKNECVDDMKLDSLAIESSSSKIKPDNFAPELHVLKKSENCDQNCVYDEKISKGENSNTASVFSDMNEICSTYLKGFRWESNEMNSLFEELNMASKSGISIPDFETIKEKILNYYLDDKDVKPFVNTEQPIKQGMFNTSQLYKLYEKEVKQYNEIKRTEKNVEMGLRLLEEKQIEKLRQIAFMLKVFANADPCFQNVHSLKTKHEESDVDLDQMGFDSSQTNETLFNLPNTEQLLTNACTKNDAGIFNSKNLPCAPCSSSKKYQAFCHAPVIKDTYSMHNLDDFQKSSIVNSSLGFPVVASSSTSQEILKTNNSKSAVKSSCSGNNAVECVKKSTNPSTPHSLFNPDLKEKQVQEFLQNVKCAVCKEQSLFTCQGCQNVCFCSHKCGLIFWENGHKLECQK